jgi:hypothetical protein
MARDSAQSQIGLEIRILVSFEDGYRSYREVIAATIRILRPRVEVATSGLECLKEELTRFEPHLVICSRPKPASSRDTGAWVELSLGLGSPAKICIAGHHSQQHNPNLETLLGVIDEVDRLIQAGEGFRRC